MNRVGLKDYLLNHADDNDLLDCAKAWDAANEYGQFDTYESVEEAAEVTDWDVAQALNEARRVDQDADFFRLNGYGHLESVSKASLLEDARDNIDDIIDWLGNASRYELEGISSDIELMVDENDPFEIINDVDCSVRKLGNDIEVELSRGQDKATLSFSKLDDIDADKIDLANVAYATAKGYYVYADGANTEEVQAAFFKESGRRLSDARADDLADACEKNMDALKLVLDDDEIEALENFHDVELCSETYCATLANEAHECKYIASALEKMGFDVSLAGLAELLAGRDIISTQSVPELLDTMADRFSLEPEERARIAERAQAKEQVRTQGPDIGVEIDSYNDDGFITGTVTVDGESCYFNCPNNTRNKNDYDSVILEPFRPVGFEGDIEDVDLPAAIDENREIVELIVSMEAAPYMDPDKLPGSEQSLDSLCDEKSDEAQSMRYGMEGVGLPMLDAAEHLANY